MSSISKIIIASLIAPGANALSLTKASAADNVDNVQVFYTQSPGLQQTTQMVKMFLGEYIDHTKGPVNFVHSVVKTPDSNGKYNLCQLLGDDFVCEEHGSAEVVADVLAKEQKLEIVDSESLFKLQGDEKLEEVVNSVQAEFVKKGGYKLLENNCNHAADDFVRRLSDGKVGIEQSVVDPIRTFIKPEMQGKVNGLINSDFVQQMLSEYRNPVSAEEVVYAQADEADEEFEQTCEIPSSQLDGEVAMGDMEDMLGNPELMGNFKKVMQFFNDPKALELAATFLNNPQTQAEAFNMVEEMVPGLMRAPVAAY